MPSAYLLGDSIFVGATSELTAALNAKGWRSTITAVGGQSLIWGLGILGPHPAAMASADAVVIELGTNPSPTPAAYASEIGQAVAAIRAVNKKAPIYWLNLFSDGVLLTGVNGIPPWKDAYNKILAAAGGINLVDTTKAGIAVYPTDHIHPTPQGSATLARVVAAALTGGGTVTGGSGGGIAGLGGSGTVPAAQPSSTYAFTIGTSSNPDEDYWTGINRLASEVNWYLFSNGENVYYLDGEEMIAQAPALELDRIKDSARILSLRGTWDDTAFAYVSSHRRKFHVQHKSKAVAVVSPTEIQAEIICGIDEVRAGDVALLTSYGPMDGRWIIGDCTRSIFSVSSSLTLVPPISPITEHKAAGTTGIRQATGTANVPGTTTPGATNTQLNQSGLTTWSGHGHYTQAPITMCKWIANELNWGIDNGWTPGYPVTSGYRPGVDPHTSSGKSEHQGTAYPGGAIDFGGYVSPAGKATKEALVALAASKNYPGPRLMLPIGFSDDGHCSGNGH